MKGAGQMSAIESTYCPVEDPCQVTHSSRLVTPVPEDLAPSSGFCRYCTDTQTHIHIIKSKNDLKIKIHEGELGGGVAW